MAVLPSAADLGATPRVSGERPVATIDRAGQAYEKGMQKFGAGLGQLGEGVAEFQLDRNRYEFNVAHADALTQKIDLDNGLQKETDYSTLPDRYSQSIRGIYSRAAEKISDPNMRSRFMTDSQTSIAAGIANAKSHAFKLEGSANVAYVREQGDKFIDQAVTTQDEGTRAQIIDAHGRMVAGLAQRGFISQENRVSMQKDWAHRYATADVLSRIETDPQGVVRDLEHASGTTDRNANLSAATKDLGLSQQETDLYKRHLGNLYGPGGVDNKDGSRSTLYQASVERDGKTYNIPTVWDGKILKPAEAVKRAEKEGWDKFPSYANGEAAEARYGKMHDYMERDTATYLGQRDKKPSSIYSIIPADQRMNLLTRARSAMVGEQYTVQRLVEDDVASTLRTGKGVSDITPERIRSAFGPRGDKAIIEWQEAKDDAGKIFAGSHDMPSLTEESLGERVRAYDPENFAGQPGFERRQRVYDQIQKRAQKVLDLRYSDPSTAVATDPDVKVAQAAVSESDPSSYQRLGTTRMMAQAKLGIPEELRTPLTKNEALHFAAPLRRMLPGQERETLTSVATELQKRYGEEADRAFEHVLREHKLDAEAAKRAMPILKNLIAGDPVGTKPARATDYGAELDAADKAVGPGYIASAVKGAVKGLPVIGPAISAYGLTQEKKPAEPAQVPQAIDITALRQNPAKFTAGFDQKYGKGAAKKILDAYPVASPTAKPAAPAGPEE